MIVNHYCFYLFLCILDYSYPPSVCQSVHPKTTSFYVYWITLVLHLFVSPSISRQQVFLPLGRASSHLVLCYGIYEQAHIVVIFQTDQFHASYGPFLNFLNAIFYIFVPYSCVGNSSFSIGFWNCTESVIFFYFHLIIF